MDTYAQLMAGLFVISLLAVTLWLLRRGSAIRFRMPARQRPGERMLESRERLSLSPQHSLHLVRVGERAVLVAVHSGGCALIESRPWGEFAPSTAQTSGKGGIR
jgi:flagellar biogenesis protein FliO